MAAMTRLDIRLTKEVKSKVEKACILLGRRNLTEYLVKLIDEDATRVIAEYDNFVLEDNTFDHFFTACNRAPHPNKTLKGGLKKTKESGM